MITKLEDKDIDALKTGAHVVYLSAEWCGPCKMSGPIFEEAAAEAKEGIKFGKVDVDANPDLAMEYGIRSIPTFLYLKDGEVVDRSVGVPTKSDLLMRSSSLNS